MGQHSIIEKLQTEVQLLLIRESQVLYLMAEIRKYLEHEKEKGIEEFPELEFFCNWALHIKVDRKVNAPHIRAFMKPFDMVQNMSLADYLSSDFYQRIMQLEFLKTELQRFFTKHSVPEGLLTEFNRWYAFVYLYTGVVSEVPLEYAKGDLLPEEVSKVQVSRIGRTASLPIQLTRWSITLKDGREFNASTAYGTVRDANNHVLHLPNFFEIDGFQV